MTNIKKPGLKTDDIFEQLDSLRKSSPFYSSTYNFDGFLLEFKTNRASLKKTIDEYYCHFISDSSEKNDLNVVYAYDGIDISLEAIPLKVQPHDSDKSPKEGYVDDNNGRIIKKLRTKVQLYMKGQQYIASGPLSDHPNQVINFINNIFMGVKLNEHHSQLLHASAVTSKGIGLAFAAPSGKGKSTLCLKVMDDGIDYVSNDRLMIYHMDDQLRMMGVPKYPRINPGTIVHNKRITSILSEKEKIRYLAIPNEELWQLEKKHDLMIEKHYQKSSFTLRSPLHHLIIINWDHDSNEPHFLQKVSLRERADLLPCVMKGPSLATPNSPVSYDLQPEQYLQLLDHCQVWELTGRVDFDSAADNIRKMMIS